MSLNKLGRYDILRVLGRGAMGMVYEARDPNLDRRVAIKTIKVENLSEEASAEYEARFRTEARSAARLQHPNIVSVYDSDRHGDVAYLVMEFVQGDDLKRHLDSGTRYSLEQSLSMVLGLLSALDYAHRQNVVHRDVKPANLLVEANGRVKLTDFGVARIQDSGEATRTRGSMVGTLKYMSPEQVQGQPIDARSDLFAVGVVLYQLLTGNRPFDGDTDFAIIQQVVAYTPPAPSVFNPQLPPALDAVVARALAKQREQRFATAHEFAAALEEAGRQAQDRSTVPPLATQGSGQGGMTGTGPPHSRTFGSSPHQGTSSNGSGPTVTQELELVYWKDIKDSGDREDLDGFLHRFPSGIYADLARRRLKKLGNPAAGARDPDTTHMDVTTLALHTKPAAPVAVPGAPVPQRTERPVPQTPGLPPAADAPPFDATLPATPKERVREPGRSGTPLLGLAGVAALVVAALAYQWFSAPASGLDAAAPAIAASAAPAPSAPASAAGAPPAPATDVTAAVAAPASATLMPAVPAAASRPASRPGAGLAAEKAAAAARPLAPGKLVVTEASAIASAAAPGVRPTPVKTSQEASAQPPAAPAPAPAPVAGHPNQACESRVLLGFQICMNEQCAKPAFANHPVCVERRSAEKLRRDSQSSGRN